METLTLVNNFSSTAFIPADEKHWLAGLGDLTQAHTVNFHLTFDTAGGLQPASPVNTMQPPFFHHHCKDLLLLGIYLQGSNQKVFLCKDAVKILDLLHLAWFCLFRSDVSGACIKETNKFAAKQGWTGRQLTAACLGKKKSRRLRLWSAN